jgi:ABC-type multidrug transport system fused ATPase/permease subunit
MIPVTKYVAQWMGGMQKKLMRAKDARVELNSEVLSGMKVIKFQAWEESFEDRILALREVELQRLFRYFIGSSVSRMFWTVTPLLVALATFSAYIWSGHILDVASALTALALFDILRFPLFMLPQIINNTVEASVALHRVRSFLLCDEHESVGPGNLDDIGVKMLGLTAAYDSKRPKLTGVEIDPKTKHLADAQWEVALLRSQLDDADKRIKELAGPNREESLVAGEEQEIQSVNLLCLKRIDFECKPGELIAVVGGVGSGKSSFVNALLGEVRELSGTVAVKGKLSYFSQSPFIMNATVRDNILFGRINEEVDKDLYQRALDCCALTHDLELLPDGDMSELGDKGASLSGGQKARVALARAVYHQGDITLVDDALSAVDAHVAKHLFDRVITDELLKSRDKDRKRSVVLVTNAVQFLNHPRVDKIVVIGDGRVVEQGSYADLSRRSDSAFARVLSVIKETGIDNKRVEGIVTSAPEAAGVVAAVTVPEKNEVSGAKPVTSSKKPSKQMNVETRKTGHVDARIYWAWAKAAGGIIVPISILFSFAVVEGVTVLSNWWLTYWSEHGSSGGQGKFLAIYAIINCTAAITGLGRMLLIVIFGLRASRRLFADLLAVVLHVPMSFFDTTPVGRIVNRFSKDIYTIDEQLMATLRVYLQTLFGVLSTVVVISGVTPIFTICLIPIIIFYVVEQSFFTVSIVENFPLSVVRLELTDAVFFRS